MFVPSSLLILSGSNFTLDSTTFTGYTSTHPPTTSPAPSSSTKEQALIIASYALLGSSPFSNFPDESVRSPSLFEESLIFVPSNVAHSNTIVDTSSVIFEFSPPMIPAIATAFLASFIIRMSLSSFLTTPSSVSNSSPSFALSTTILCPSSKS